MESTFLSVSDSVLDLLLLLLLRVVMLAEDARRRRRDWEVEEEEEEEAEEEEEEEEEDITLNLLFGRFKAKMRVCKALPVPLVLLSELSDLN